MKTTFKAMFLRRNFSARHLLFVVLLVIASSWLGQKSLAQEQAAPRSEPQSSVQAAEGKSAGIEAKSEKDLKEAEGEEKDETEKFKTSPSVNWVARATGLSLRSAYWLCVILNFAVIAGVLIWVSRTKLVSAFRARTQLIQKGIEEARKASAEANQRLAEIEARLAKLGEEIGAMSAAAEKEAAAEEARLKAAAEEDAHKIVTSAEQEIAAAAKSARRELKAYVADLAVSLAQTKIFVDNSTDQALVRSFSSELGTSETGGGMGKDGR